MAKKLTKEDKTMEPAPREINFRCPLCQQLRPIETMKTVTRFFPLLVVCQECEKELR